MIPHDGPACPTPLEEEEEEPPWDDASAGIVSSSIVKKGSGSKNGADLRWFRVPDVSRLYL